MSLSKPSIKPEESISKIGPKLMVIDDIALQPAYDWMSLIKANLNNQAPSDDNTEVERIACRSKMYHLIDGVLYRQSANGMMMKCISREEGIEVLEDIHKGVCKSHSFWHGFY
jgi:hypothetical protein